MCLKDNFYNELNRHSLTFYLALVERSYKAFIKSNKELDTIYSNPNKEMEIKNSFDSFKMSRTIVFKFKTVYRSMLNLFKTKLEEY